MHINAAYIYRSIVLYEFPGTHVPSQQESWASSHAVRHSIAAYLSVQLRTAETASHTRRK